MGVSRAISKVCLVRGYYCRFLGLPVLLGMNEISKQTLNILAAKARENAPLYQEGRATLDLGTQVVMAVAVPYGRPSTGLASTSAGYRTDFYLDGKRVSRRALEAA